MKIEILKSYSQYTAAKLSTKFMTAKEHIITLDEADFENGHYVAMLPVYDDPEESLQDSDPLVIMKQITDGDDQFFEEISDEEEFSRVADFFSARLEDIFDIED